MAEVLLGAVGLFSAVVGVLGVMAVVAMIKAPYKG